jgi:hypothetical protein
VKQEAKWRVGRRWSPGGARRGQQEFARHRRERSGRQRHRGLRALSPLAPAAGQEPPAGRFQIAGIPGHAYVLDTATGQVWETFGAAGTGSSDGDFKSPKLKGTLQPGRCLAVPAEVR